MMGTRVRVVVKRGETANRSSRTFVQCYSGVNLKILRQMGCNGGQ